MWQVFLHLWNQLFYTPNSWFPVSVTHTDITHVHTPYLGRLCPYKPDFCPKFKFHWAASTPRRSFWTLNVHQLVVDVTLADLSHFGMLGDILASFWHSSPSPSAVRTYLLSTWSHARHSSCYITWWEVSDLKVGKAGFPIPCWNIVSHMSTTDIACVPERKLLEPDDEKYIGCYVTSPTCIKLNTIACCFSRLIS